MMANTLHLTGNASELDKLIQSFGKFIQNGAYTMSIFKAGGRTTIIDLHIIEKKLIF